MAQQFEYIFPMSPVSRGVFLLSFEVRISNVCDVDVKIEHFAL